MLLVLDCLHHGVYCMTSMIIEKGLSIIQTILASSLFENQCLFARASILEEFGLLQLPDNGPAIRYVCNYVAAKW